MPITKNVSSFAMGEVDQAFWKFFTDERYWQACKQLRNITVTPYGAAKKRAGTIIDKIVSELILDEPTTKADSYFLQAEDSGFFEVEAIRSDGKINLRVNETGDFQTIIMTDYTPQQLLEASIVSVGASLTLWHQKVKPHRITYVSILGTFAVEILNIDRPPCFDLGYVDYFSAKVSISLDANKDTQIVLTGVDFGSLASQWIGGTIEGPGMTAAGATNTAPRGFGIIKSVTRVASPASTTFILDNISAFDTTNDISLIGFGLIIKMPIMTDEFGYCGEAIYYQDRLWLTRHPKREVAIFGSRVGIVSSYDTGIGLATDGISYEMDTINDVVLFMNSGRHLEVFTSRAQYSTPSSDSGLTPTNTYFKLESPVPVLDSCRPISFQNYTFFAGADGKSIYSFMENQGIAQSYSTTLVSQFSSHLIKNPRKLTVFTASSQTLTMLAVLNSDDTLALFQFNPNYVEGSQAQIQAWTSFYYGSDQRKILDVYAINNKLKLLVKTIAETTSYTLEYMDTQDLCFVDGGIAKTVPQSASGFTIDGLDVYNGMKVRVASNTVDLGEYLVELGSIKVNNSENYDLNAFVGIFYQPFVVPLSALDDPNLAYNYKSLQTVFVNYTQSLGILVNGSQIPFQDLNNINKKIPITLQDGTFELFTASGWLRFSDITITQIAAVAFTILSIAYRIAEGDG